MRLHDFFDYHSREQPDACFAVFEDRTLSWAQAGRESNRMANALARSGVAPGDRVAILAKNCIEFVLFYYAAAKAGAVPVPLNYRLAAAEWQGILEDASPTYLLARGDLVDAVAAVQDALPGIHTWVALDAAAPDGWLNYEDWLRDSPASSPSHVARSDDDVYQMYTSGTTGRPKGAILTHAAVCAQLDQVGGIWSLHSGDDYLIVVPMYHAAAAVACFVVVHQGATLHIMEEFDPAAVIEALSERDITATTLVPAMIQACLVQVPGVADRQFDALRFIAYGASPIAAETLRQATEVFGCGFYQAYGMTETTAVLTFLTPAGHGRALASDPGLLLSCGRPLPGTEVRVVDADDRALPCGEIGEIVARGPQMMRGYWNMTEATGKTLAGGWMHTGDAGCIDAEGYLFVRDRVKDMIVSGAENVYPREVENALYEHPAIADAAVIGVPDEKWGETVKAVVVLRDGHIAREAELIEFCRARIAHFKCPRSIDFIAELPRNPSGKVLKKDLREPYWSGTARRVN